MTEEEGSVSNINHIITALSVMLLSFFGWAIWYQGQQIINLNAVAAQHTEEDREQRAILENLRQRDADFNSKIATMEGTERELSDRINYNKETFDNIKVEFLKQIEALNLHIGLIEKELKENSGKRLNFFLDRELPEIWRIDAEPLLRSSYLMRN